MADSLETGYEILDFEKLDGISCPCGLAKRALLDDATVPYSLHLTDISVEAKRHYHKRITETYFVVECGEDAKMELDDQIIDLRPQMSVVVRPGTRHRALGNMKVVIIATPKFDPDDEWFDES